MKKARTACYVDIYCDACTYQTLCISDVYDGERVCALNPTRRRLSVCVTTPERIKIRKRFSDEKFARCAYDVSNVFRRIEIRRYFGGRENKRFYVFPSVKFVLHTYLLYVYVRTCLLISYRMTFESKNIFDFFE